MKAAVGDGKRYSDCVFVGRMGVVDVVDVEYEL